jgi:hypothetical protein
MPIGYSPRQHAVHTAGVATFTERQAVRRARNYRWLRAHPRSSRAILWVVGFDVVIFLLLAVAHAVHSDWSGLYFAAQALVFGILGWRWLQDSRRAEQVHDS